MVSRPQPGTTKPFSALLIAWCVLCLWAALKVPLIGDEAYYWLWSRHLEMGYFDHPPAVAWMSFPFEAITGGSKVVFRCLAIVSMLAVAALTARAATHLHRSLQGGGRERFVAFSTAAMVLLTPLLAHYSVEMGPDTPLLLGWSLALERTSLALVAGAPIVWLGAWLGVAVAILAKLTGWLLAATLMGIAALEPWARRQCRGPAFWGGLALALTVISPHLWWNWANHGTNYAFQWGLRVAHRSVQPGRLLQAPELLTDLGFVSLLALPALIWGLKRARSAPEIRLLLWMSLPIHGAFLAVRMLGVSRWNWPMPGYLPLIALTALWLAQAGPRLVRLFHVFLALTALWSALAVSGRAIPELNGELAGLEKGAHSDEMTFAFAKLGAQLAAYQDANHVFLLEDEYTEAAALTYYSGRPVGLVMPHREGSQFLQWNDFDRETGQDALFIAHRPLSMLQHVLIALQHSFESYERLSPWEVQVGDKKFLFFPVRCHRLRQNWLDHAPPLLPQPPDTP